jgi:hypothetical protein
MVAAGMYTRFHYPEAIQNKTNLQAVEKELAQATRKIEQESDVSGRVRKGREEGEGFTMGLCHTEPRLLEASL